MHRPRSREPCSFFGIEIRDTNLRFSSPLFAPSSFLFPRISTEKESTPSYHAHDGSGVDFELKVVEEGAIPVRLRQAAHRQHIAA